MTWGTLRRRRGESKALPVNERTNVRVFFFSFFLFFDDDSDLFLRFFAKSDVLFNLFILNQFQISFPKITIFSDVAGDLPGKITLMLLLWILTVHLIIFGNLISFSFRHASNHWRQPFNILFFF